MPSKPQTLAGLLRPRPVSNGAYLVSAELPGVKKEVPSVKLDSAGEDYQLQEALNLLKGISIFRAQKP